MKKYIKNAIKQLNKAIVKTRSIHFQSVWIGILLGLASLAIFAMVCLLTYIIIKKAREYTEGDKIKEKQHQENIKQYNKNNGKDTPEKKNNDKNLNKKPQPNQNTNGKITPKIGNTQKNQLPKNQPDKPQEPFKDMLNNNNVNLTNLDDLNKQKQNKQQSQMTH